jgi:hypothetical protein
MWPKLAVLETRADPQSSDLKNVVVGFKGTPVLRVAVMKNKVGSYGIYNLVLEQPTKQLITMLDGNK